MEKQLSIITVSGIEAATAFAGKLVLESVYFEVTPLPENEFEFGVKKEHQQLLIHPSRI